MSDEKDPSHFKEYDRRDGPIYTGDAVSLVLVPDCNPENTVNITVDYRGQILDSRANEGGWSTSAKVKTNMDRNTGKWRLDLAIPFSDLQIKPRPMALIAANFIRHYKKPNTRSYDAKGTLSWFKPAKGKPGTGTAFETGLLILE